MIASGWGWIVAFAAVLAVPLAAAAGYAVGSRARKAPPAPAPPAPPTPAAPTASPPRAAADPYLARQVALLQHRHIREAAEFIAHSAWVDRHRSATAVLIATSDQLLASATTIPDAYRTSWRDLVNDLRGREEPVARVAKSLRNLLQDPALGDSMPFDTAVAWRALMPHTEVAVTDEGKALADLLFADLARATIGPYVALGQLLTEAAPVEVGLPKPAIDVAEHARALAEALGYRYEHVELYERTDADFMLDRDVTVTGVEPDDVWHGCVPRSLPDPGVVVRVPRPCLRRWNADGRRALRGHLLVLKGERPDDTASRSGAPL